MRVFATAGHVDHGKSSLVLALTGTDPDRWEEEKRRGLTIDLGFAFTTLPSGAEVGFVDVPGHVRFLKNMLAGAGAVDAAVLVVAASEGWMPQTEEHLRILELLGIEAGFTVLTMADAVDSTMLELAQLEVMEHLEGTFLEAAPVVTCDSISGAGLDEVRAALDGLVASLPPPVDLGRPRLFVDRVFSAKGAGTVVTGTLTGGTLTIGDTVVVVPSGAEGRVRSIQSGHTEAKRVAPGARVALNLAGVERDAVERGSAVVLAGQWISTDSVEVRLVRFTEVPLHRRRIRLKAYVGSGEHEAVLIPLGGEFARVDLAAAAPLAPGDRLVLRDPGPGVTLGGAEVLEVRPPADRRGAVLRLELPLGERLLAATALIPVPEVGRRAGVAEAGVARLVEGLVGSGAARLLGDAVVASDEVARLEAAASAAVGEFHHRHPLEPGMDVAELAARLGRPLSVVRDLIQGVEGLLAEGARVRAANHAALPATDPTAQSYLAALTEAPFSPPAPADVGTDPATVRALVRAGAVVDAEGVYFARDAYDDAVDRIVHALRERGGLTVGEVRDLLASSRRHVLPLLNRLDREGITRRKGDVRELGPRAPTG